MALRAVPAVQWAPILLGIEVPERGPVLCPWHEERTASCHAYGDRLHCFGACSRSFDIFDAGELVLGIEARGPRFPELRDRLADRLLGLAA